MKLNSIGGFSNRCQAILSYLSTHGHIEVFWDGAVQHFLDVMEEIPGVTFTSDGSGCAWRDYGIPSEAPPDWRKHYALLRPVASIRERVAAFQESMGPDYVAMHVRRTDMSPLAARVGRRLTTDEEYRAFMAAHPDVKVWIAADNGESQVKFGAIAGHPNYDPRVCVGAVMGGTEAVRDEADHPNNGPLVDAIVDMWVCIGAKHYLGSGGTGSEEFGTFTATISNIRSLANGVIPTGYPWAKP